MLVAGCTHKWEDHNEANAVYVSNNLFQKVEANSSLSQFAAYLKQTGYADSLSLSKNYTVWAPDNNALKSLSSTVINDTAALKKFVAHHIAYLSWRTANVLDTAKRIPLLDGKQAWFSTTAFDNAPLSTKDSVAANGVLHIISQAAAPIGSCWDYIDSLLLKGNDMAGYIYNYQYKVRDLTNAVQVSVNPYTGEPIYQEGTDSAMINRFTNAVYDLKNESGQYTVFVLANTPFGSEGTRFAPYYATGTADSTANLAKWSVVKDLAVEGAYAPGQLPDSITSKYGVRLAVKKSAIVASYQTSNGYVYVMNEMGVSLVSKFPTFIIQGENYSGISATANIFTRNQYDSLNGGYFTDMFAYKPPVNQFFIYYRVQDFYTTTYNVYWRVVNNTGLLANPYSQKLAMDSATSATFPYTAITPNVYQEVFLGTYKRSTYGSGTLNMFLVSANVAVTATTQNAMLLDYIRLEPVR